MAIRKNGYAQVNDQSKISTFTWNKRSLEAFDDHNRREGDDRNCQAWMSRKDSPFVQETRRGGGTLAACLRVSSLGFRSLIIRVR